MPDDRPAELTCPGCEGMSSIPSQPDCELCRNTGVVPRGVFNLWAQTCNLDFLIFKAKFVASLDVLNMPPNGVAAHIRMLAAAVERYETKESHA